MKSLLIITILAIGQFSFAEQCDKAILVEVQKKVQCLIDSNNDHACTVECYRRVAYEDFAEGCDVSTKKVCEVNAESFKGK